MRRRRFIRGRGAHQARNRQPVAVAAGGEEAVGVLRQHAGLLRLSPVIDLGEQDRAPALLGDLLGQRLGEAWPIDRMDGVEQGHRLLGLVRLQWADEMQLEAAIARPVTGDERRPFGLGLLDAILAEHALPCGDHRLDRLGAEHLRDRDQRDRRRVAPGIAAGRRDLLAHAGDAFRSIHGFHLVNAASNDSNFSKTAKTTFRCVPYCGPRGRGCVMLDNHTKARKPSSWRSKPILSIRARLLVLALLAIAPLVFDRVHGLELARGHRIDRARTEVIDLARRATESQREIIYSVRALLQIVARAYAKMPDEAG